MKNKIEHLLLYIYLNQNVRSLYHSLIKHILFFVDSLIYWLTDTHVLLEAQVKFVKKSWMVIPFFELVSVKSWSLYIARLTCPITMITSHALLPISSMSCFKGKERSLVSPHQQDLAQS